MPAVRMEMKLKMDIGNQCIEELTSSHYVSTSSLCIECLANIKDFFSKDNEPVQWEGGGISPVPASHAVLRAKQIPLVDQLLP